MRVCAEPGCPTLCESTRCETHDRRRDRERGTRQQRGYDAAYDREKRRCQRLMDAGHVFMCWRCPELGRSAHAVNPMRWHLGHVPGEHDAIRGPQCPESNLDTAAQRAH